MPEGKLEIKDEFPEHMAVLEKHSQNITLLSKAENHVYQRELKPLAHHVMFLGAIDVNRTNIDDNPIDIRKAHKPSEIEEAKDALDAFLSKYMSLNHLITLNSNIEYKINDLAAEAAIEIADVVYNLFQVELFNERIELGTLTRSVFQTIDAELLDMLLSIATIKFTHRYIEGELTGNETIFKEWPDKNIIVENALIRESIKQTRGFTFVYDAMLHKTGAIKSMLLNVLKDVRKLSEILEIRYDNQHQDRIIPDEVLF